MPGDDSSTDVDDLTPEWLTHALRAGGALRSATVTRVHSERVGEGWGYTGRIFRLRLDYDVAEVGAPLSIVAKLASADPHVRSQLNSLGVYAREFGFYSDCADPDLRLPVPLAYDVRYAPESGATLLLLEDLERARPGDNVGGCSDEDAYLAVSQIARCHAAYWEHNSLETLPWLRPLPPERWQEIYQGLLPPFLETFADVVPDRLRTLAERFATSVAAFRRRLTATPRTLVHGDFRLDNLLFGTPDGHPLTIIDWQLVFIGLGVADVAYFAAFCLWKEQRRAIERQMIRLYHAALVENGIQGYELSTCWEDYRFTTLIALVRIVTAGAILDYTSERGKALSRRVIDQVDTILDDHNVGDLLPL